MNGMLYHILSTECKKSVTPIKIYKELLTFCAQVTNYVVNAKVLNDFKSIGFTLEP